MSEQQQAFFQLVKQYETLKDQLNTVGGLLDMAMNTLGVNTYHQDPETGLVYKIHEPDGTFVSYRSIGFKRTAKEGERGGAVLSKKEAEEQGFILRK